MAAFKLKKGFMVGLATWLNEQRLSGGASRARTRFVEMLIEGIKTMEKDREELLEKFVEKDEVGKRKIIEAVDNKNERWDITPENQPLFDAEYLALTNEDFLIDVNDANREVMKSVRHIVLDTDYIFGPADGMVGAKYFEKVTQMNDYPKWCESFEELALD